VKIEDGVTIKPISSAALTRNSSRVLVVDDHLRFQSIASLRFFAELNEPLGIEQGIRVPFKTA